MTNPLLASWNTPFELPPFDRITDDDFGPAFDTALDQARANYAVITANPDAPDFDNTIAAMERADALLDRVARVFFNLAGSDSNPAREALQRELSPKLAAFSSEISLNPDLFARVSAVWQARHDTGLTPEQIRVVELSYEHFQRAGAALTGADRDRYAQIMERLAVLGTQFTQNLLADERDWTLDLGPDDLTGLPDFAIAAMKGEADARGRAGHTLTLARSVITPFLQFSDRRDLRETAFRAWEARGANGGDTDNRAIATETLKLREERARLLGFDSFAAFKLDNQMAGSPDRVRDLLMAVWEPARARALQDAAELEEMMHADGINGALEPWDWRYYAQKRQQRDHQLDEAELKPFFRLDAMIDAAFDCANRLFGLSFTPIDVPLYHEDARAWEVTRDGQHVAVFIGDYFARPSKRSGAWCSSFRGQQKLDGDIHAIAVNTCNFSKPPAGENALLSWDDAHTLFHEFGHALHVMLSDVTYPSIAGTAVARDFVELPSQLYEHWLEVPEVLAAHATRADTGQALPPEMLDRIIAADQAGQGFATVEYTASALVDLAFHDGPAPDDAMARQAQVLAEIGMPHAIVMRHATPQFAHVFSGDGYSAGYYSYMWSEVMDADAFAAFTEAGDAFDQTLAASLRDDILSRGGSDRPEALYTAFRGRLPGIEAILRQRGFSKDAA